MAQLHTHGHPAICLAISLWPFLQGLQGAFMPASPTARGGNMRAQQQQLLQQQRQQQELLASLDPRQQAALLAKVCAQLPDIASLVSLRPLTAWAGQLLLGLPWCLT